MLPVLIHCVDSGFLNQAGFAEIPTHERPAEETAAANKRPVVGIADEMDSAGRTVPWLEVAMVPLWVHCCKEAKEIEGRQNALPSI
jgi:hypothetical protein